MLLQLPFSFELNSIEYFLKKKRIVKKSFHRVYFDNPNRIFALKAGSKCLSPRKREKIISRIENCYLTSGQNFLAFERGSSQFSFKNTNKLRKGNEMRTPRVVIKKKLHE
jgi:hypothetical protein